MFANPCLGKLQYESTTAAIVMAGIIISFLIDYITHRFIVKHLRKPLATNRSPSANVQGEADNDSVITDGQGQHNGKQRFRKLATHDVLVLEAGIIFHSLCELPKTSPFHEIPCGTLTLDGSTRLDQCRRRRFPLSEPLHRCSLPPVLRRYRVGHLYR